MYYINDLFNRLPIEIQQEIMNEADHSDFETQIERFSDAFVIAQKRGSAIYRSFHKVKEHLDHLILYE